MGDGGHILLVEDDFAIRETVADVLEGEGFEVACAANGEEALARLGDGSSQPGVILLDLMMPVMDGWAFRSAQRLDPRIAGIPVVVVSTGAGAEETLDRLAPDAFLPKPFDLDRLLDVVGRYCVRH
jgi:CheY-like chemotaxis protein